jgi:hypothetical protein
VIRLDVNAIEFGKIYLYALENIHGGGVAMATAVGQKLNAVLVAVLDLRLDLATEPSAIRSGDSYHFCHVRLFSNLYDYHNLGCIDGIPSFSCIIPSTI